MSIGAWVIIAHKTIVLRAYLYPALFEYIGGKSYVKTRTAFTLRNHGIS